MILVTVSEEFVRYRRAQRLFALGGLAAAALGTTRASTNTPDGISDGVDQVVVVDVVAGDTEDNQGNTGNQGGNTDVLDQGEVDDTTDNTQQGITVVGGDSEGLDTLFQEAVTVNGQVGTSERSSKGIREGSSNHDKSMSTGVGLDNGVGKLAGLLQVVRDVGGDESLQDNLHEEDGSDQGQQVVIKGLVGLGRQSAQNQRKQEPIGTEGSGQGKSNRVNQVLGLLGGQGSNDGNGIEKQESFSYVGVFVFEAQDLHDWVAVQRRHFDGFLTQKNLPSTFDKGLKYLS